MTAPARLRAQLDHGGAPLPGGDAHWYLRSRALLGDDAANPWGMRRQESLPARGPHIRWLRPELRATYNSRRPEDADDGVVWAGRGVTGSAQAGFEARWGIVHLQIAPVAFRTENRAFPLAENGQTGLLRFGDARFPGTIDLPQRFGDAPYARVDAGDSFLALEWRGLTAGVSSARQLWGPAREFPLVLGTRAGGFTHLFVGTDGPVRLGVGTVDARLIAGRLEQTTWSPLQAGENRRFHSGLTVTVRPRWTPWLEIGGNRTETSRWPEGGPTLADALGPFRGIMNAGNTSSLQLTGSNGFASAFTRVAIPGSGLEFYGEVSWEDFANDLRRFVQKIDDLNTVTLGVGRAWSAPGGRLHWLGLELTNGEVAHQERGQRGFVAAFPPYTHTPTVQGLTSHGQVLGSLATFLGSAASLSYQRYGADGRIGLHLRRALQLDGTTSIPPQVALSAMLSVLRFSGRREWLAEVGPTYLTRGSRAVGGGDGGAISATLRWRGF